MATLKTRPTGDDVEAFLNTVEDPDKRDARRTVAAMMAEATGAEAQMWGKAIVGFGRYHYKYASGREGDWFLTGFSPRKQSLTLYIMDGFSGASDVMSRLGKHKTGKSCLYIKRLTDIDLHVLRELIEGSVAHLRETYGTD